MTESSEPRKVAKPPRQKTAAQVTPSIPCPSMGCAHGRLVASSAFRLQCDSCKEVWELHGRGASSREKQPKPKRVMSEPPVIAIEVGGERVCTKCRQPRQGAEFCPGSHPNTCRACRQEYRRQLAQRKAHAA